MQGGWGLGHDAAQVGIRASTSQEHHIHMVKRVNPGQIRRSVPLLSESLSSAKASFAQRHPSSEQQVR